MTVYLHLFHGRDDPNQDMDDWGSDGPVLGPFRYVHITYLGHIKFSMETEAFKAAFPDATRIYPYEGWVDGELDTYEDMILYQGKYYGDFSISTRDVFEKDKLL